MQAGSNTSRSRSTWDYAGSLRSTVTSAPICKLVPSYILEIASSSHKRKHQHDLIWRTRRPGPQKRYSYLALYLLTHCHGQTARVASPGGCVFSAAGYRSPFAIRPHLVTKIWDRYVLMALRRSLPIRLPYGLNILSDNQRFDLRVLSVIDIRTASGHAVSSVKHRCHLPNTLRKYIKLL